MNFGKTNIILLLAFTVSLVANWAIRPNLSKPNVEYFPNMARSVPYDAFSYNPNFVDGMTLREPVEGTIVYGRMPLHYGADTLEAIRAGEELTNPYSHDDTTSQARGAALYGTFCQTCHGASGVGDGPVAQRGYPPPPPLKSERAIGMKDGRMFHIITFGQGNMPPYASQISREDRWKIVLHLRSLQE